MTLGYYVTVSKPSLNMSKEANIVSQTRIILTDTSYRFHRKDFQDKGLT